ncbi:MAG: type VI secretion system tip protein VgrG [Bacteroidetes Order II. Incertae sedis bacterium]|nr:type VI secretion system tip protein VgrG [Bacteroidetes Order II. bacterium]
MPANRDAHITFEAGSTSTDSWEVLHFQGREAISELFRFDIDLISDDDQMIYEDLINQTCHLYIERDGKDMPFHGLVSFFKQGHMSGGRFLYEFVMVPRLTRLGLGQYSRVFQNMSILDIIKKLLSDGGFSAGQDFELPATNSTRYPTREFTIQYQESDLDFIFRQLEHYGMFYYFDHSGDVDKLMICDDSLSNPHIEGGALPFHHEGGLSDSDDQEIVRNFIFSAQLTTGKTLLDDYYYRSPNLNLAVEKASAQALAGLHYEYAPDYQHTGHGNYLVQVRQEYFNSQKLLIDGESDCGAFRSGLIFSLEQHYRSERNIDYLLTEVRHEGSQGIGLDSGGNRPKYANHFRCIPANVPFRPERKTTIPRIHGIITAKVESAGGQYAFVDKNGEYHVKLPFDQDSTQSGQSSLPIRMSQPYTGADYGIHFPNHANTEMVLAFMDGNVDRPMALGTIPNPSNNTPVTNQNAYENIIRTWAGNILKMSDEKDKTKIQLTSADAHDLVLDDEHNKIQITTKTGHVIVMDDDQKSINIKTAKGHDFLLQDEKDGISGFKLYTIDKHYFTIVDKSPVGAVATWADKDTKVGITLNFDEKSVSIVSEEGDISIKCPSGKLLIETAEMETKVGGDHKLIIDGKSTTEVKQAIEVKAMEITNEADTNITSKAGANHAIEAGANMDMKGINVNIEAQVNATVKANVNANLQASVQANVKGTMAEVSGSAMTTIKGGIVMIN